VEYRIDREALAEITVPTLLLVGTESPEWAVRSTEAYEAALPYAEKAVLEGQGHSANIGAPDLLASELTRFLSK